MGATIEPTSFMILKMFSKSFLAEVESQIFSFNGTAMSFIVSRCRLCPAFWSSVMSCFMLFSFSLIADTMSSFFESSASFTVSNFIVDLDSGSRLFCLR